MALKFIFGGSGSGKSYYSYEMILKDAKEHPEQNYIVLVPEQFTMQTQKDLVCMSENHGIMNVDVLSFLRLAHRVFEETGKGKVPVLDDEGKNLVLRKIAQDVSSSLVTLGGNMKKLGYISEVKSVISEFTQYDIGVEDVEAVMESVGKGSALYYKLQDMCLLYRKFQEYLQNKFITKEEVLDVLANVADCSNQLKNSTILLDGFTGFTPVQIRLLGTLLKLAKDVIVTVTIDPKEDPFSYKGPYELFAMSKHTVSTLVKTAKEEKIPVEEPIYLKAQPYPRFQDASTLSFLEQSLFRYRGGTCEGKEEEICLFQAKDPKAEAKYTAAMVRKLIREKGYRYKEIGVIAADMDTYADELGEAFRQYGIPVFQDQKRSILLNSFVEYVRSLLAMVDEQFSMESVFRYLRAGYFDETEEAIDSLENYCLATGVRGYKKWQAAFEALTPGMEEEALTQLNHTRVKLVEQVDHFRMVMKHKKKTVKEITLALYEFLVKEKMEAALEKRAMEFQEMEQFALAKEYEQVYGALMELFDKFVELLGDEPVSTEEYRKLLDAGLLEIKVGVIPPGVDQVVVGDLLRTRLKDVKALFFLGANDCFLPGALMRTGLLTEKDREKFAQKQLALTPGGKEQAYVQKFYLYLNLTKPTKQLIVGCSKISAGGKNVRPSYLIQELQNLYPNLKLQEIKEEQLEGKELTEETGLEDLIRGLRMESEEDGARWAQLYTWYKKHPEWRKKVEQIVEARFYHCPSESLKEELAKALYGEDFRASITRMERFSACAYAHFLTYGLALKPRQEYEFAPLDLGNVIHTAIEYYGKQVEAYGGWTKVSEETKQEILQQAVTNSVSQYGNGILYSSSRAEYMITRIKKLLTRTVWAITRQLEAGDFRPESYEMRFGSGKIDRVDICEEEDKVYVKVVDYKTGSKAFDISDLYYGLQMQLLVYMNAAMEHVKRKYPQKEILPAGVFYYRIKDPLVEKASSKVSLEEQLLKELCPDGIINETGSALEHLDREKTGGSTILPVKYNKDGSLSKYSKVVTEEEFRIMGKFTAEKIKECKQRILQGEIQISPYRQQTDTGCDYCPYQHVCGFDHKIPGYTYRELEKLDMETALQKMQEKEG